MKKILNKTIIFSITLYFGLHQFIYAQQQCLGGINASTYSFPTTGGSNSFTVWRYDSECTDYSAWSNAGWLSVSVNYSNSTIYFTASANPGPARSTTISVVDYGTGYYWYVNVSQAACTLGSPGAISGPLSACAGSTHTYSISPVSGATYYSWTLPPGATGSSSSTSINVTFGTETGYIIVRAHNNAGCTPTSRNILVSIASLVQYNVSGGGTICQGSTAEVTLAHSYTLANYRLYLNGSLLSSQTKPGTNGPLKWYVSAAGTYTVKGVTQEGCEIPMSGSAVVNVLTRSTAATSIAGTTPVCPNTTVRLTATGGSLGQDGSNWYWYANNPNSSPVYIGNPFDATVSTTTTYYVQARGTCGNTTTISKTIAVISPPVITQNPTNVTVCEGSPTSFSVTASGASSYQWQQYTEDVWTNVPGATSQNLNIPSTEGMGGRLFHCLVTGPGPCYLTTTSSDAYISFNTLFKYNVTGGGLICPDEGVSVGLDGSTQGKLYRCYVNGSLSTPPVYGTGEAISFGSKSYPGVYTVTGEYAPGCEISMSQSATITVRTPSTPPSSITADPPSICPGDSSTLTLHGGSLEPGFGVWKWYSGAAPCGSVSEGVGVTSITVRPEATTTYYARAEGGCAPTPCVPITVEVRELPAIIVQPTNSVIYDNQDATFSISAAGTDIEYQWQYSFDGQTWSDFDGPPASGWDTPNLILDNSEIFTQKLYRCAVTSPCDVLFSESARIIVVVKYLEGEEIPDPENRPINTSLQVGSTGGSISTTQLGGLAYSIPIYCPPGTNGVQPSISIQYNSQSGNGLLGWGWNLAGLSSISRIPKPYYVGQEVKPVNMDSGDEFALDGNRLVYDQGTSNYKTEIETFSLTTAHGTSGQGPDWFEVRMKDSSAFEYGNGPNSYLKNSQNTKLTWYLTKYKDVHGNYIMYNYSIDQYSGQVYLSSIQYTGNETADLDPYNEIIIHYRRRSDPFSFYFPGVTVHNDLLITKIECKTEGQTSHTYEFGYKNVSINSLYSTLVSVKETSREGSSYNSTIFDYFDEDQPSAMVGTFNINGKSNLSFADFNGDGRSDLVVIPDKTTFSSSDKIKIYVTQGSSFELLNRIPINPYSIDLGDDGIYHFGKFQGGNAADFNGDGKSDFYTVETVNNSLDPFWDREDIPDTIQNIYTFYYYQQDSLSFHHLDPLPDEWSMIPGDYNGDGKTESFYFTPGDGMYGPNYKNPKFLNSNIKFTEKTGPIEFNGDGKTEVFSIDDDDYLRIYEYDFSEHQLIELNTPFLFTHSDYTLGDVNGDGKTDIISVISGQLNVFFSDGSGFIQKTYGQGHGSSLDIADINGDGKGDICESYIEAELIQEGENYYYVYHPKQFVSYLNGDTLTTEEINVNYSGTGVTNENINFADFDGDGSQEQLFNPYTDGWNYCAIWDFRPGDKSRLLGTVLNGLNNKSEIRYGILPNSDSYSASGTYNYPVVRYPVPLYLVENIKSFGSGNIAPSTNTNYLYQNLRLHAQGKGILGFSKVTSIDSVTKARVETRYGLNTSYYVAFTGKSRQYQNNVFLSETTDTIAFHSYDSGKRYFSYNPLSITENKINGTKVQVSSSIDQFGNLSNKTTYYKSAGGSTVKQVVEAFSSYDNNGNPGAITVTSTRKLESIARTKNIFYNSFGNVDSVVQLFTGAPPVITTFDYDIFGNITAENTVCDSRSRIVTMGYEPIKGRFLTSKTNALDHSVFFSHDPVTGNVLKDSTQTSIVTSYQYDGFGNMASSQTSGMPAVNTTREWSLNDEGAGETYYEMVSSQNSPAKKTYYDYAGREKRSKSQSFDGTYLVTDKEYDSRGRLIRSYLPYFEGSERDQYITYTYDSINRVLTETKVPGNITTSYTYYDSELKTKVTSGGKDYYKQNDASGMLFRAIDPGGSIIYSYNAEDKIDSISSPSGLTRITYDTYGNQDKLHDLDAGDIDYDYNGLGELITQVDFKGNTLTNQYDASGRIIHKSWGGEETTTYSYYPDNELVKRISSPGGAQIFTYDNLNRLISKTDSIEGNLFTAEYSYNPLGKIDTVIYNSSVAVANNYNNLGYLDQIKVNNQTIWSAQSMNRYGAINSFTLGNQSATNIMYDSNGFIDSILTIRNGSYIQRWGYDFNTSTGNLTQRTGLNSSWGTMQETFTYDDLNRLTSFMTSSDTINISYEASGTGNIESKSDVGDYDYTGGRLHDVRFIQNPTALMLSLPKHEADYTKFNKISYLRDSISADEERRLYLTYGPGEQRVKTIYMVNSDTIKTKYFALGNYEKEIDSAGITRVLYYISAPSGLTAILQRSESQDSIFYVHTDYLGSYDVVTTSSGTIRQRYNFDPWGRRRNPLDWTYSTDSLTFLFDRGFTGHEHLDQFGLINMNGRVYDPLLAMFLSPDNYVQNPSFTQNFNRYSYAYQNPLIYTDPSGNFVFATLFSMFCPVLAPFGAALDGASWSAAIDAGMQGIRMLSGKQEKFNYAEMWGAAAGGATATALSFKAPSGYIPSMATGKNGFSISDYFSYYSEKAAYTAGASMTSAFIGNGVSNLISGKNNQINLAAIGAVSYFSSFLKSFYDFATWDRFSESKRLEILEKEFPGTKLQEIIDINGYAVTHKNGLTDIDDYTLQSRNRSRWTMAHETIHVNDYANPETFAMTTAQFDWYSEPRALYRDYLTMYKYRANLNDWLYTTEWYHKGGPYSKAVPRHALIVFDLFKIIRNFY